MQVPQNYLAGHMLSAGANGPKQLRDAQLRLNRPWQTLSYDYCFGIDEFQE
jgi:hypothetical protein